VNLCNYGCGLAIRYQLKNGKWCCGKRIQSCPAIRKKTSESIKGVKKGPHSEETKKKISDAKTGVKTGPHSEEHKKKISEAKTGVKTGPHSEETKKKISEGNKGKKGKNKLTIEKINKRYPLFSKIETMRYNEDGDIQVHCKNHDCDNSKEKGGWFTPTSRQLYERRMQIEFIDGNGGSHFYCSQHCKDTCIIFNQRSDPLKENILPYTQPELDELRRQVVWRDENICQYCGEEGNTVHHTRPVKLEPFLALDAVYAITVCKDCHIKYGHKKGTICSTGNLAAQTCNPESQKFLNQKKEDK